MHPTLPVDNVVRPAIIRGLQIARVHIPLNGFGAAPSSTLTAQANRVGILVRAVRLNLAKIRPTATEAACAKSGVAESCPPLSAISRTLIVGGS